MFPVKITIYSTTFYKYFKTEKISGTRVLKSGRKKRPKYVEKKKYVTNISIKLMGWKNYFGTKFYTKYLVE